VAHFGKECAELVDQELGLLEGEEVSYPVEVDPTDDVVIALGEPPDGDVVPRHGDTGRDAVADLQLWALDRAYRAVLAVALNSPAGS
jgi:hypothetical protein